MNFHPRPDLSWAANLRIRDGFTPLRAKWQTAGRLRRYAGSRRAYCFATAFAIHRCHAPGEIRTRDLSSLTRWHNGYISATEVGLYSIYSRGLGLGIESGELLNVQFSISVAIETLEQHDDFSRWKVERRALQDDGRFFQRYIPVTSPSAGLG